VSHNVIAACNTRMMRTVATGLGIESVCFDIIPD
jgi:hypothetical protein